MSAILRISGKNLDAKACAQSTTLPVVKVYQRGQPVYPASKLLKKRNHMSGLNIRLTPPDGLDSKLYTLVRRARTMIKRHRAELRRLRKFPGVQYACLDFGVPELNVAGQFEHVPHEFLLELGRLRIDLEISIYHAFRRKKKAAPNKSLNRTRQKRRSG